MLAEQPEIKHLVTRIQDALMQLYAMTRVGLDYVTILNRILNLNFRFQLKTICLGYLSLRENIN